MSSIRRILSGISSAANWATRLEVTAPIRHQPTAPVEPVRRGFSDHSDFQSATEAQRSLLDAHSPNLTGQRRGSQDPMRAYSGLSDFQGYLPRYQHLLGLNVQPPPNRYWEAARSRSAPAPIALPEQPTQGAAARPGLTSPSDLEESLELAGEDDSVLLYTNGSAEAGRSVIQHPDGSITDPTAPDSRFADAQAWEGANPELKRALTLSRSDLELVLAMPEGPSRDEVLAELAGPDTLAPSEAASDAFIPSMDDLPMALEPGEELAASDGFMPSLEDLPGTSEPVAPLLAAAEDSAPLSSEELEARFSPTGLLAEGQSPVEVAELVARRGTTEMQARVATALYEQSRLPEAGEAPSYARAAALAGSASPEATQALLQHAGEAQLADFVRAVMQG